MPTENNVNQRGIASNRAPQDPARSVLMSAN